MRKVLFGLAVAAVAGYVAWTKFQPPPARLAEALGKAKRENKLVLLDFTGSDWCGWCMKLEADALGKPEFLDYAAKYLVTVVVDFPMQHQLPSEVKAANKTLKSKFDVSGFPTLVALSPDGKEVWRQSGYVEGGPFAIIAPINRNRMALGLPQPEGAASTPIAATETKPAPVKPAELAPALASAAVAAKAVTPTEHGLPVNAPKLQGIVYSQSHPTAMLGGRPCSEGDSVGGMRVMKILRDKVVVEWEGRTEELTMH